MNKPTTPLRVISLLPSATEVVCALGAAENLVGISHECDFPPEVQGLPVLTSSRRGEQGARQAALLIRTFVQRGELARRQIKKGGSPLLREQQRRQQESQLQSALDAYRRASQKT